MQDALGRPALEGLERLCTTPMCNAIVQAPSLPGIERIEARFFGEAFAPHRHDTYALGVTLHGVQTFRYRGEQRFSTAGGVIVLHPDELHDGAAGSEIGLRYRMLYLEPALLQEAFGSDHAALPFVAGPVLMDGRLRAVLLAALARLDGGLDELFVDDLVCQIAEDLARHAGSPRKQITTTAWRGATLARDYLQENAERLVRSCELESITGLDRYALTRHFRAAFGTSPHRFLTMRRLDRARQLIAAGEPLAQAAAATGFADQSHLNRAFKKTYGMPPRSVGRSAGQTLSRLSA